jgi:dTDP-4-amino-4,6-dideoxygalactose transaminase
MIPSNKPSYSFRDLHAALSHDSRTVDCFERELAVYFDFQYAITFPYGRSALYATLRALGKPKGEVVQPAYNCVVVAHATVTAGHQPVFIDASAAAPNQDADRMVEAVGPRSVAVIPTSLYGIAFDAEGLYGEIRRRNRDACILVDCCQAFGARWDGRLLMHACDGALLAFGIGKPMTTLNGGALLTNRSDLAASVYSFREQYYRSQSIIAAFQRLFYFVASWAALSPSMTALTDFLMNADTPLRRYLRRLRAREEIRLPEDNEVLMLPMQAAIGRQQLHRLSGFMKRRREIAESYSQAFQKLPHLTLLPWGEGSTFAIYTVRLRRPEDRNRIVSMMRKHGVQCDTILNYVIPGLDCYRDMGFTSDPFPHARSWSESVLNLANHPSMTDRQVQMVIRAMQETFGVLYG